MRAEKNKNKAMPLLLSAEQVIYNQSDCATRYERVGYVEGWPVPIAIVYVDKIDNTSVKESVQEIANCSAYQECTENALSFSL